MKDLEAVYDAEIAPLMEQIIAIAQRCDMPFVALFQLNDGDDQAPIPLLCTSTLLPVGCSVGLRRAFDNVRPDTKAALLALVVRRAAGGLPRDN